MSGSWASGMVSEQPPSAAAPKRQQSKRIVQPGRDHRFPHPRLQRANYHSRDRLSHVNCG